MDKLQIIILISLISISTFAWIISKDPSDMMKAMMTLDPALILLFTASWSVGMVAMMFPAISPMVLLYNRLIKNDKIIIEIVITRKRKSVISFCYREEGE